jgi:hypothetical protein
MRWRHASMFLRILYRQPELKFALFLCESRLIFLDVGGSLHGHAYHPLFQPNYTP